MWRGERPQGERPQGGGPEVRLPLTEEVAAEHRRWEASVLQQPVPSIIPLTSAINRCAKNHQKLVAQLSRSSGPLRQDSVAALEANRAMFARLRRKAFGQLAQWDAWLCAQVLWESASMEVPFSAAD
jgi:hypothetical protein